MVDTALFHLIEEGIPAAIDWLAAIEKFLRDPTRRPDYGAAWHLLYHLYNWQQFEALLPVGREGVIELLQDIQHFLEAENDPEGALRVVKELRKKFEGNETSPQLG